MVTQCLSLLTESGRTISRKMYNLLQFWNVIGSIATFTLAIAFGLCRVLLVGDKSFWENPSARHRKFVSIKVMILSGWKLTTQNLMYLYVGPPEEIHHHVWLEGFK